MSSTNKKPRRGFSLVELITVLAILTFLIATAVGSYFAWNQTSALRGATDLTLSGLNRARQFAITHRVDTYFFYNNYLDDDGRQTSRTIFNIQTNGVDGFVSIAPDSHYPVNIQIMVDIPHHAQMDAAGGICFKPNGRFSAWDQTAFINDETIVYIYLNHGPNTLALTPTILLDPLTGHARPHTPVLSE